MDDAVRTRFIVAATERRRDRADALLAADPALAGAGLDVALVLGDADRVRAALAEDPAVAMGAVGVRGWPALCVVAFSAYLGGERTDGLLACAQALLDAGADPNATWTHPEYGPQSALSGAAGVAHEPRLTALLLEAGANPDDDESLYHAMEEPQLRCARLLLAAGAAIPGTNALGHALDRPDPDGLRLLLEHLDGVGEAEALGLGPLVPAAVHRERDPVFLELLAGAGADLEAVGKESGQRGYALAVHLGRADLAATLERLGARPQAEPLDVLAGACRRADRPAAEALLAERPKLIKALRKDAGIGRAAADGNDAAVTLLLDLGVPIEARGHMGGTLLHWAAWWGRVSTVELLLARGADVGAPSPNLFDTPLGWAVHGSANNGERAGDPDYRTVGQRLSAAGARPGPDWADAARGPLAEWLEGA